MFLNERNSLLGCIGIGSGDFIFIKVLDVVERATAAVLLAATEGRLHILKQSNCLYLEEHSQQTLHRETSLAVRPLCGNICQAFHSIHCYNCDTPALSLSLPLADSGGDRLSRRHSPT